MRLTKKFYTELDKKPLEHIQSLTPTDLKRLYKTLNDSFHEKGINLISDDSYDTIKEYIDTEKLFNTKDIGAPVKKSEAVTLPYWMGSMNKLKENDEKELSKWLKKYTSKKVISDKLDGVSGMYMLESNGVEKLYTRGDGEKGRDISHLIDKIDGLKREDKMGAEQVRVAVRGELIISRKNFKKMIDHKEIPMDANPRNTVAGLVNAKTKHTELLRYVDFVAYEVIVPEGMMHDHQLKYLSENKYTVVTNKTVEDITIEFLSETLKTRRDKSEYDIDGIIVTSNTIEEKNKSGNPEYAFAFKLPTSEIDVTVKDVIWEISKDRYLKPIILFDEVYLSGAKMRKTTGFNAKYIVDNMIGKESIVTITRSGEVIPYITKIKKQSDIPLLPQHEYVWTKNKVDIVMVDKEDTSHLIKLKEFQNTISSLKIKGLSDSTVEKLFKNGVNTLKDLLNDNLLEQLRIILKNGKLTGLGYKQINNIVESINDRKETLTCIDLMVASNIFGRGISYKTLEMVVSTYPDMLANKPSVDDLTALNGVGDKIAKQIHQAIENFNDYVTNNNLVKYCRKEKEEQHASKKTGKLSGVVVLFTGNKDKKLIEEIKKADGEIASSISRKVDYLIMENVDQETEKKKKALKYGMIIGENILTPTEFVKKLEL